mmetsp:Transcript_19225/g.29475  ORF Transcript_19225/g.29475 Transcript_19225/m.29475 type:complete len:122 (+) Transcript_19225:18-383(+)
MENTSSAQQPQKKKKIGINFDKPNNIRPTLEQFIKVNPIYFEAKPENAKIQWVHSSHDGEDTREMIRKGRIVNHYPDVKDLSRKDAFQMMMSTAREMDGDAFDFVPPTFVLPFESEKFSKY